MIDGFSGYEDQYNDIVNYSGLNAEEIKEILEEVKRYFSTYTLEYTIQNVLDIVQFTSEMILSYKTAIETKRPEEKIEVLTIPDAIQIAVNKVIFDYTLDEEDENLNL